MVSRFSTISFSDPLYETDNLRYLTFKSPALRGRGDVTLFIPPEQEESTDLNLIILLHGVYGSHWDWTHKGGAHRTALQMIKSRVIEPCILAIPSDGLWGDGSGYVPHEHANYEQWIVEDLIDCVIECLPQLSAHSAVFIGGLSMGGFGALRLGVKYPHRFRGISGHSSVTSFEQMAHFSKQDMATYRLTNKEQETILYWVLQNREVLPPLRFDCGLNDPLLKGNRELHESLNKNLIPHIYQEFDGGHNWAYWREHLRDSLLFFNGC